MSRLGSAHWRFAAALGLFLVWVGILTLLAVISADRPQPRAVPSPDVGGSAPVQAVPRPAE